MMQVPGYLGYSLLGDKSLVFVRSPHEYIAKQRDRHGDVFKGRILNKTQIFLTSNKATEDLLLNKFSYFSMAYKYYLEELFGEVMVFLEGDACQESRELLVNAFSHQAVSLSLQQTRSLIQDYIGKIEANEPLKIYKFFKELSTRLSISLFLSHDIGEEDAREISALMTSHWRGIISVPLPISIPWSGWKSRYGKALEAKEKLLKVIQERLLDNPSVIASEVSGAFREKKMAANHLLLFVSALIPKAMSSLLTSTIIELSKSENLMWQSQLQEESTAQNILLEVERLWPPFFGGARVCTKSCEIDGYHIPEGAQVAYISHSANRDERVFPHPDTFSPERWTNENAQDKDRVWTFGGGIRKCIGEILTNNILKGCLVELSQLYRWELVPNQDLTYKTLPISRPKDDIQVTFIKRTVTPTE